MDLSLVKTGCCGFRGAQAEYEAQFPVVETQQTFYQPPRLATLERWRAQAPAHFEFTLKAWQLITHPAGSPTYKRLTAHLSETERRECGGFQPTAIVHEAWLATRACAEALGAQCILFQCPASFAPTQQNVANLRAFFLRIKRSSFRLLWEPRGAWPDVLVEPLCQELDLVHVVDPFLRRAVTREFFYYRLHGGKDFRHCFTDPELRQLLAVIPEKRPAYVLFNNVNMLEDAKRFQSILAEASLRKVA